MLRRVLPVLGLLLSACLTACGGGSDVPVDVPTTNVSTSTGSAGSTTSSTQTSTTLSSSNGSSTTATCGLANFQAELLSRINSLRARGAVCGSRGKFPAVAALSWQNTLAAAAAGHSNDMATHQYFSHTDLSGHDAGYRMRAAGYTWSAWAENIAAGQTSVQQVMDDWTASPDHCANLMNANVTEIGVACAQVGGSSNYWTMNLGRPL